MDSYIVRIYRKHGVTNEPIGTIEEVACRRTQSFHSYRQLELVLYQAVHARDSGASKRVSEEKDDETGFR